MQRYLAAAALAVFATAALTSPLWTERSGLDVATSAGEAATDEPVLIFAAIRAVAGN
ncbi:hypothetical protein [Jannaschia formosa]|uniref:hypothetical protein n=1 Tax=Jannaschia formosa TaxID=2259592 RepID=UPI00143026FF|nr:hypothetical protein [Jannaschia formosa]